MGVSDDGAGALGGRLARAGGVALLHSQELALRRGQDHHALESGQENGQDLYLRLGEPATPVPKPRAGLLPECVHARANMNTATDTDSRWLRPGGRAGRPLTAGALRQPLHALGLPTTPAALSHSSCKQPRPSQPRQRRHPEPLHHDPRWLPAH